MTASYPSYVMMILWCAVVLMLLITKGIHVREAVLHPVLSQRVMRLSTVEIINFYSQGCFLATYVSHI